MVNEAIILAGGLGTRLREEVPDLPKCMAPVAGRPFLYHLVNYFRSQGIQRFIFSVGYKHGVIADWLKNEFSTLDYELSVEETPLGTGGAVALALARVKGEQVVVTNGDTLFKANIGALQTTHKESNADCTLALKSMQDFDRYGAVEIDERGKVTAFREKQLTPIGFINGGLYLLDKSSFLSNTFPEAFSFEKEYLELLHANIYGHPDDGYFIDIGIPEDYRQANKDLQNAPLLLHKIDKNWTLFIDRDGVINPEKKGDYIRNVSEFSFYEGALAALAKCADRFGKVIVVSNQRGVGRQLMTEQDLQEIHIYLETSVKENNGRIDRIYYCTATDNLDMMRKPNPGMAFLAAREIPGVDLAKAMMVGNKPSDMKFGRYAGVHTVYIASTNPETPFPHPDIDLRFNSLEEFANAL